MQNVIEKQEEFKQEVMATAKAEIVVIDQETYVAANDYIGKLQTIRKEVVARFKDPKSKAAEAHKAICELEKSFLAPVDEKIKLLKDSTTAWYAAEQQRKEAEAERQRKEAEQLVALAAEAESAGDEQTAAEAVFEAVMAKAEVSAMPKCTGTSMREVWTAVVTDENKVPREYLMVNMTALNALAKATKGKINITGVKFEKTFVNATRSK